MALLATQMRRWRGSVHSKLPHTQAERVKKQSLWNCSSWNVKTTWMPRSPWSMLVPLVFEGMDFEHKCTATDRLYVMRRQDDLTAHVFFSVSLLNRHLKRGLLNLTFKWSLLATKRTCLWVCNMCWNKRKYTLPKLYIAPEKWWLEDYFPFGKVTFQGLC